MVSLFCFVRIGLLWRCFTFNIFFVSPEYPVAGNFRGGGVFQNGCTVHGSDIILSNIYCKFAECLIMYYIYRLYHDCE